MNRRLYRCRENRILAGVASGVAEFFGLDPTLVRILWFFSLFVGGLGIIAYIGLAIIVPLEPLSPAAEAAHAASNLEGHRHTGSNGGAQVVTFLGIALVLFGSLALLGVLIPDVATWRYLWPAFIIGIGAVLIAGALRRNGAQPEPRREPTDT